MQIIPNYRAEAAPMTSASPANADAFSATDRLGDFLAFLAARLAAPD